MARNTPATTAPSDEIEVSRLALYNRLNKIAHRAIGPIVAEFKNALNADPAFTARLLVYIAKTSRNRDAVDAAIVTLLSADPNLPGLREAGRVLALGNSVYETNVPVGGVEPFRILRILNYLASPIVVLHGTEEVDRFTDEKKAKANLQTIANRLTVRANRGEKDWRKWKIKIEPAALTIVRDKNYTRPRWQAEGILKDWLKALSASPAWLDSVAILNRAKMVEVIRHYRVPLDSRANGILFKGEYPADSVFNVIRKIAETTNAQAKCKLALDARLPLQVATSVLGDLNGESATPQTRTMYGITIVALMTPAQATNSTQWFEQSGLAEIPEVKAAFLDKVRKDTKRGVAAREQRESAKAQSDEVREAQAEATKTAIAKARKIVNDLLLLVDKSRSMDAALVRAVEVGAFIAPYCAGRLKVVAFNDTANEISVDPGKRNDIDAWRRAFALERANGGTSMAMGLRVGLSDDYRPAEIVFITDGQEYDNKNSVTRQWKSYGDYRPHVTILKCGNYQAILENSLRSLGLEVTVLEDPVGKEALDIVAESLMGVRGLSMVETIMKVELPARVEA